MMRVLLIQLVFSCAHLLFADIPNLIDPTVTKLVLRLGRLGLRFKFMEGCENCMNAL